MTEEEYERVRRAAQRIANRSTAAEISPTDAIFVARAYLSMIHKQESARLDQNEYQTLEYVREKGGE